MPCVAAQALQWASRHVSCVVPRLRSCLHRRREGETTAALGLALRPRAWAARLHRQFMKGRPSGEHEAAKRSGWPHHDRDLWERGVPSALRGRRPHRGRPRPAKARAQPGPRMLSGDYRLVVLDEVCVAIHFGLLSVGRAFCAFLREKPRGASSGSSQSRQAPPELVAPPTSSPDTRAVKHYLDQGVRGPQGDRKI